MFMFQISKDIQHKVLQKTVSYGPAYSLSQTKYRSIRDFTCLKSTLEALKKDVKYF